MASHAEWERQLFHGTAGSTASTQCTHVTSIEVQVDADRWDTTDRGDGSAIPFETFSPVTRKQGLTFTTNYYSSDAPTSALIAAAEAQTLIALKVVRYSGGDTMVDTDFSLTYTSPGGMKEGQPLNFTAYPSKDNRTPSH